jgi:hypothetical protein
MRDPGDIWVDARDLTFFDPPGLAIESGGNAHLRWCHHEGRVRLFKQFTENHLAAVDAGALAQLIRWRRDLPGRDRDRLDDIAAWPLAAVREHNVLVGVLVPAAGDRFFSMRRNGSRTPRDLFELTGAGDGSPAPAGTLIVLGRFIQAVRRLHAHGVVVNDLQPANVLCAVAPDAGVYVVDCDSTVSPGRWDRVGPPAAPDLMHAVVSPDAPPTVGTDLAKLLWVVVRVLLEAPNVTVLGDHDRRRLADAVTPESRNVLLGLLDRPADPDAWDALARQWAALTVPVVPVPPRPRGWLPPGYAYQPDPGPPVLPARLLGRRAVRYGGRVLAVLTTLVVTCGLVIAAMARQ